MQKWENQVQVSPTRVLRKHSLKFPPGYGQTAPGFSKYANSHFGRILQCMLTDLLLPHTHSPFIPLAKITNESHAAQQRFVQFFAANFLIQSWRHLPYPPKLLSVILFIVLVKTQLGCFTSFFASGILCKQMCEAQFKLVTYEIPLRCILMSLALKLSFIGNFVQKLATKTDVRHLFSDEQFLSFSTLCANPTASTLECTPQCDGPLRS